MDRREDAGEFYPGGKVVPTQPVVPAISPVSSVNGKTGAVVLSASDVDAVPKTGGEMTGQLRINQDISGVPPTPIRETGLRVRLVERYGNIVSTVYSARQILLLDESDVIVANLLLPTTSGTLALLSDIYAAVQQIAPDFTARAYATNDLCTYNGVVYRCKAGYTATASSQPPNSDTTHWEAKKVSELFLPSTGGTIKPGMLVLEDPTGFRRVLRCNGTGGDFFIDCYDSEGNLIGSITVPSASGLATLALLNSPAFTGTPTAPNLDAQSIDGQVVNKKYVDDSFAGVPLRYDMPTAVALVAENDEATLVCADRAVTNATIAAGFSTLNLTFPAAVSGKVRDFYLRITVAAGESAPALSIPQGITIENPDGAVPEIADGETSAASTTLVWFSETAPNVFTAKSETVKAVA